MTTSQPRTVDGAPTRPRWGRARLVLLVACYGLLSLWATVMSGFGPALALSANLPEPSLRFTAVGAGAFKVLTLGPAVAVLLSRGRSVLAVRVLLAGQVVWLAVDLLAPQEDEGAVAVLVRFVVSTAIWVGPWLLLSADRRRLWSEPVTVRRVPAALAAVAVLPLLLWARANAGLDASGTLPGGGTYAELRYDLTGLPLAVLTGLGLATLHRGRWWSTVLAAVCLVVGLLALVYPDAYGSPGAAGAGLLVVAVALGSVVLLDDSRAGSAARWASTPAGSR
jgi:hypothetical protein